MSSLRSKKIFVTEHDIDTVSFLLGISFFYFFLSFFFLVIVTNMKYFYLQFHLVVLHCTICTPPGFLKSGLEFYYLAIFKKQCKIIQRPIKSLYLTPDSKLVVPRSSFTESRL